MTLLEYIEHHPWWTLVYLLVIVELASVVVASRKK